MLDLRANFLVLLIFLLSFLFRLYGFKIHPLAYSLQYQQAQGNAQLPVNASPVHAIHGGLNASLFGSK